MSNDREDSGRRRFFRALLAAPLALAVVRFGWPHGADAAPSSEPASPGSADSRLPDAAFAPTPECGDDDEPTPAETAGPFFKPRSPHRTSLLEPGVVGTRFVLAGRVFARGCRPLSGVLIDFWHADDGGEYDNEGFKLRGHQFTDTSGHYRLETIVPGLYPGRTRHFHVRVQAPGSRVLTTQLYFPDEPRNRRDSLFRSDLLMSVKGDRGDREARFHFMLDVA